MLPNIEIGDKVRIVRTGNPHVDGAVGRVESLEPWGAHLSTVATTTCRYRATWDEMDPVGDDDNDTWGLASGSAPVLTDTPPPTLNVNKLRVAVESGYSGDVCVCGSFKMRRAGNCLLCEECWTTGGCS